jgi:diguanylate cyclase (GGDEF)-like protein
VKILIADDGATSRRIAHMALRSLGHDCHAAIDGIHASEVFQSVQPDVVISDWTMPGLTGLQLCRNIRADPSGRYTYFIMVTSRGALDEILEGMNAGADDYLVKPFDPDDLRVRLIAAERVTLLHRELDRQRNELRVANDELTAIARRDPLTGLGNRRALEEDLEVLDARVARYGHRYCMALVDVDFFKSYNDGLGHPAGDDVLRRVAVQLRRETRGGDTLYRYGGDEFLCIFPEQSVATGSLVVERMRSGLEQLAIPHGDNPHGVLTISAGMAMLDSGHVRSVSAVLDEADAALYRAKELGRNRVEHLTAQSA